MAYILFVDDDPNILKINKTYFEAGGYTVAVCQNAEQALLHAEKYPVDCAVLDISMPGTDGFSLCRRLKSQLTAPVIFLTSFTEKEFLYEGFATGGDDFLTKPCDLQELELRVATRIRQKEAGKLRQELLEFPPLVIDVGLRQVRINGVPTALTSNEFDILLLLARSPRHVFSPDVIYREVWKMPDNAHTQTIKVHMARMRHKLEAVCPDRAFLGTAWKQGYYFLPDAGNDTKHSPAD